MYIPSVIMDGHELHPIVIIDGHELHPIVIIIMSATPAGNLRWVKLTLLFLQDITVYNSLLPSITIYNSLLQSITICNSLLPSI